MFHFFASGGEVTDGFLNLTGQDVRHITRVLRLGPGARLVVSDNQDRNLLCEIAETGPDFVRVKIVSEELPSVEMDRRVFLFQGLPKSDKMDYIVTKCVELGVTGIVPVEMERCVVRLEEKKKQSRRERWQKLAESAAKQSGRGIIPEVEEVLSFEAALRKAAGMERILVPYESAENMAYTREMLAGVPAGSDVAVFIGPEGGFDSREIEKLREAGAGIITLGPRILRTETAGLALLAMAALLWEK